MKRSMGKIFVFVLCFVAVVTLLIVGHEDLPPIVKKHEQHFTNPWSSAKAKSISGPKSTACINTNPHAINTWRGNGLVTALYPPIDANCQQLQAGNSVELARVRAALKGWNNSVSDRSFYENLTNCSYSKKIFSPNNFYVSETEKKFPLAYVILFHDSPQQIVRLLKLIYRPQNVYCLHPDGKASPELIQAFRKLADCLDNVFVPRELVKVTYLHFSMVEAQMLCLQQLATTYKHWQWKYAMILCGKEIPSSTNRGIVDTLQRLNGASVINIHNLRVDEYKDRFGTHYSRNPNNGTMYKVGPRINGAPFNVTIYKSSNYIAASNQFVEFLLTDGQVEVLSYYMHTAKIPDEEFFATAYMLQKAPKGDGTGVKAGGGRGFGGVFMMKAVYPDYKNHVTCYQRMRVHYSCILTVHDLPMLFQESKSTTYLFYNKYLMQYDHVVMDCMERRIVKQNQLEYKKDCL